MHKVVIAIEYILVKKKKEFNMGEIKLRYENVS